MSPRRLGFSCMCTSWLPVVPVVGAAPLCLCLVPLWHRVRCDVIMVCWLDAFTTAWSGIGVGVLPFVARVALLACVGGLTFIVRVCLEWFPALVSDCVCMPGYCISLSQANNACRVTASLCNIHTTLTSHRTLSLIHISEPTRPY